MSFEFKQSDFKKLAKALGVPAKQMGNNIRFVVKPKDQQRKLALEIYPNISIGNTRGNLISVYTPTAHLQLHFCSGFVISELMNEVTFIGEDDGKMSGLIIEKEGGCSLYANVDRKILSGDFTKLGPQIMLSGIALSLTEPLLEEKKTSETKSKKNKK
ncbi:MAG: hypothetical protein HYZ33_02245 [Ignavibacteriales bacterium]|nr:hypothetical protein [Ignavibacteriales bacterium]